MTANGKGADTALQNRPGVPMEWSPPHPVQGAHWQSPDWQEPRVNVLMHADRDDLTPVFGTSVPPRGLSGVLRRLAYRIPEHKVKHWLLLLLADRIDWQESRIGRIVKSPITWALAAVGAASAMAIVRARAR